MCNLEWYPCVSGEVWGQQEYLRTLINNGKNLEKNTVEGEER
jgi:hypothetical protein